MTQNQTRRSNSIVPAENVLSSPQLLHSQFMSLGLNSGFDYDFVDKLDAKYECSICLLALRNPTQTQCGHRFCRDCIISCISGCNQECPIDKLPLSETGLFHDSCIEREILHLKVKCPNASLGCKFEGDLKYIEDHIHACVYQPVLCPNECSVTVLQKELDDHLTNQCLHRLTKCNSCTRTFAYNQEQIHLAECPLVNILCGLCGKEMPRESVAEHRNESCPFAEVACAFIEHGCQFKSSRNDMKKHNNREIEYHIQLLSAAYKKINTLVLDMHRNIGQVASGSFTRQPSLRSQVSQSSFSEGQHSPSNPERTLEGTIGAQGLAYNHLFPLSPTFDEKQGWNGEKELMHSQQQSFVEANLKKDQKDIQSDMKLDKKPSLEVTPACSSDQSQLFKTLSSKCLEMNQRLLEEGIKIDSSIRKVDFMAKTIQLMVYDMNGKFCNGTFVWKIPQFAQVCTQMEKGNTTFHSPPFYSSQFGYKFCLRTNLCSIHDQTFLTLYIHLMQGENDDFLSWPFRGKISLAILDCKEGASKRHIVEDMEVTDEKDVFKRPTTLRSTNGYGFKEFVPLTQILNPSPSYDYLKSKVLYVKAVVVAK